MQSRQLSSDQTYRFKTVDVRYRDINDFNEEYREKSMPDQWRYGESRQPAAFPISHSFSQRALVSSARSKLANVLFTKQLQRRLNADNIPITALAVHPGWVFTEGVTKDPSLRIPVLGPLLRIIFSLTFMDAEEGAHSTVFCAASPAVREGRERYQGAFVVPDSRSGGAISAPPTSRAENAELAEELWTTTEKILSDMGL